MIHDEMMIILLHTVVSLVLLASSISNHSIIQLVQNRVDWNHRTTFSILKTIMGCFRFQRLICMIAICYPIAALSSLSPRRIVNHMNHVNGRIQQKAKLPRGILKTFKIPRGGSLDGEEATGSIEVNEAGEQDEPIVPLEMNQEPIKTCAALTFLAPLTGAFQSAGSSYSRALVAYPIITKSLTAGLTFLLSDYSAQQIESPSDENEKKEWKHNWTRTLTSAAVGLFYFGPAAHAWYEMIFKILPGTGLFSTLQKALLGQIIFGPAFTCVFFATSLMQGGAFTMSNWASKIKSDLPGAWLAGVGFWPLVDFVSYALVPIQYIPLFVNLCSFVWTIYLSMIANKKNV